MSVSFARAIVAGLREYGVTVLEEPGWESRGNGTTSAYLGALIHHTASRASYQKPEPTRGMVIAGRSDLPGPLCNMLGLYDGRLRLIAAHPANHAGASGGRSMGPLPTTRSFNRLMWGLEIDYDGVSPMSPEQHHTAVVFGAVVTRVLRRPGPDWVRAHAETSITGKYDPGYAPGKTIDMAAYRGDVWAAVHSPPPAPGGFLMALTDAEQADLKAKVDTLFAQLTGDEDGTGPDAWGWPTWRYSGGPDMTLVDFIRSTDRELGSAFDLAGRPGPDRDSVVGHVLSLRAELRQLRASVDTHFGALAEALARAGVDPDVVRDAIREAFGGALTVTSTVTTGAE